MTFRTCIFFQSSHAKVVASMEVATMAISATVVVAMENHGN